MTTTTTTGGASPAQGDTTGNASSRHAQQQLSLLLRELTAVHPRSVLSAARSPGTATSGNGGGSLVGIDGSLSSPLSPDGVVLRDMDSIDVAGDGSGGDGNFDPVSYAVRQVLKTGHETFFGDILTTYIQRKEAEIEKICASHYHDFVESLEHVTGLRTETGLLREQIKQLDDELMGVGLKAIGRANAVLKHQKILLNIEQTLNITRKLTDISEIFVKINEHITNRKYYSALKLLEECAETHLTESAIIQLDIVKQFRVRIPILQNSIRLSVLEDMKMWQDSLKSETERVGVSSMEFIKKKNKQLSEMSKDGADKAVQKLIAISSSNLNLGLLVDNDIEDEKLTNPEKDEDRSKQGTTSVGPMNVNIDFKPLYQCVHIHDVLGKRVEFAQQFEEGRRVQCGLMLNQRIAFENGDLTTFRRYLENIAGFFIVEGVVLNSTQNFRSSFSVEALWSNTTTSLNDIINESLQNCKDPGLFDEIKTNVEEFIQTMDSYGYDISSLQNLLTFILNRYSALMKEITHEKLIRIVEEDAYTPMIVDTQEEFNHLMRGIYFKDEAKANRLRHVTEWADSLRFPKPVPFTSGFPKTCNVIRDFIQRCYDFSGGFVNRSVKADEFVHECVESLLSDCLAAPLINKFQVKSVSQVVQVLVNIDFYLTVIPEFERFLSSKLPRSRGIEVRLNKAVESFKTTRMLTEKKIYDLINGKIDDFLEVADYDWNTTTQVKQPSSYLDDLFNFLNGAIVSSLVGVPSSTKNDVYASIFKHLSRTLLGLMMSTDVKRISLVAVHNFEVDVNAMEKHAIAMGLDPARATTTFMELHQTLQYLQSGNYEEITTPSVREKKYSNVKASTLITILEKLKEGTLSTSFSLSGTMDEKQKKKDIENAIRGIRQVYGT